MIGDGDGEGCYARIDLYLFRICIWLPFCLTSRNPCCENFADFAAGQPSQFRQQQAPIVCLVFLMLHSRNFRVMLDFNGRFWFKVDKETQNFALRSILKEHLYCFLQVFLRLIDSFPLACNSKSSQ